ncbi:MAG: metalloregulator ArsR/SmtB family transcription factor [Flavobacteriaceae bacterium]|nr:metalloregulator ArsR/SmtB family transcription factor [Flavobacteriaceae bacterium]
MRRDVFQAIADPTRRDIIQLVAEEPLSINEIAKKFEVSRPAISKHLKILNECGIIGIHQQGRERYCSMLPQNLLPAFLWIEQYKNLWENRIDNFEDYLKKLQTNTNNNERNN